MVDFLDPNQLADTTSASVRRDLGELAEAESQLEALRQQLSALPEGKHPERARLHLEAARMLNVLERGSEAWPLAYEAFGEFLRDQAWETAAESCDVLYQTGEAQALAALGQGIWLAVTFPVDPEITIHLLSEVVEDTPDDSDGAAVAAATACFIADVRSDEGTDGDRQRFFSQQLLGNVARRHSQVDSQQQFDAWVQRLELDQPDKFLVRLRNVVDVLVQDDWWFDRDALQAQIPEE
jgi:hypothetical protein